MTPERFDILRDTARQGQGQGQEDGLHELHIGMYPRVNGRCSRCIVDEIESTRAGHAPSGTPPTPLTPATASAEQRVPEHPEGPEA